MLLAAKSASTGQIQLCVTSCVFNSSHINVLSFNVLHVIVTSDEFLQKYFLHTPDCNNNAKAYIPQCKRAHIAI